MAAYDVIEHFTRPVTWTDMHDASSGKGA